MSETKEQKHLIDAVETLYAEIRSNNPELDELEPSLILGMKLRAVIDIANCDTVHEIHIPSVCAGLHFRDSHD